MGRWKKAKSPTPQQGTAGAPEPSAAQADGDECVAGTDKMVHSATDETPIEVDLVLVDAPAEPVIADQVLAPVSQAETPTAEPATTTKRLSALDAASLVLTQAGKPMNCQELVGLMAVRGLWATPKGKTPAATLYSALIRDIATKGRDSRFKKTGRGYFASNLPTPNLGGDA